jgi:hypothetical protein
MACRTQTDPEAYMRRIAGVALAMVAVACSPAPHMATTLVADDALPVRKVVLLPIDLTVLKDGGRYDPAETVADSRLALGVARDALAGELAGHGIDVVGELAWSGRIVLPDGRFGAPIVDEPGMARLADGLLAGEPLPRDVAVRLLAETGADALVLVSGHGTRLSGDKLAAQIAAGSAIGIGVAAITAVIVLAAVASKGDIGGLGHIGGGGGGGGGALRAVGDIAEFGVRAALLPLRIAAHAPVLLDAALYLPAGHVEGPYCSAAYGIHDGVAPVPKERPKSRFWSGSRIDLSITFIGVREGRSIWSANAERHTNALRPAHMRALFRDLLSHAPTA